MFNRLLSAILITLSALPAMACTPVASVNTPPTIPLLRLKLVLDATDYDDIAIGFLSTATTQYNNQLDSRYFPGIDSPEGLSSLSSDNVPLSVNIVPLPGQAPLVIRLDVEAQNSGAFTLEQTELDSIPQIYDIWLMDKFSKDSLNLRTNTSYAFNITKSDTTTFGGGRFQVVIRQNPAFSMHLLSFDAEKTANGNTLSWTTENEQNTTLFVAERSIDNGATFFALDSLLSTGAGSYTYTDKTPMTGANMYRLRLTDANGTITYSNVVTIDDAGKTVAEDNNLSIYPNPSSGMINLSIKENTTTNSSGTLQTDQIGGSLHSVATVPQSSAAAYLIKIVNIKGAVVRSASSGSSTWQDNLGSLSPGTYIVQVTNSSTNKVVGKSTFIKL